MLCDDVLLFIEAILDKEVVADHLRDAVCAHLTECEDCRTIEVGNSLIHEQFQKLKKSVLMPPSLPATISCQYSTPPITSELLREELVEVMASLSPQERDVLRLRFGLSDGRQRTLEEVATYFGVTREYARQIEASALRKLRRPNKNRPAPRNPFTA